MSRRLHRSNRELRGSNALLEEKVEERTSELEMANRSLEEEIAERQAAEEEVRKVNSELSEKNDLLVSAIHELKAMNEEYEATNEALIASEQELIVSERKFRNLVESIRVGVIAYEPGKGIVIANRFAVELLKTSVEEMRNYTPNNSAWRLIRDDGSEMEPFEYPINTVLATREPLLNCTLGIRHPGSDRTVSTLISAFPEFDTSGILKQVVMTITDISELNELRRELIESRERFRSMVENINDLVCEVNGEREFTYASPVFFKQLGYRPEEIVGAKPSDILHPDDLDEARKRFANLMEKGGVSNDVWRIRHSDGRWLWMECSSSAVARSSGEKGIVIISRDITGRRMIEESLLQSEKKYKSLTQRMSDMLWTADLNLKTTYVSPSIEKVLGFTPEERMRQSIEEMVTPQSLERAFDALRREMEQEKKGVYRDRTVVIELDFYRKNGTIAVIESLVSLIRDEDGAVVGMQGISRDITERKRLEEESKINDLRVASLLKMSQQTYDSAEDVLWSALDAALVLSASAVGGVFFFNAERGVFSSSMFSGGVVLELNPDEANSPCAPENAGPWGAPVLEGRHVIINGPVKKSGFPENLDSVHAFMAVPVYSEGGIVAVIGVANGRKEYTPFDARQLSQLMDSAWKVVENRRAEDALRESEQRFRQLADSSFEGILIHDGGRILDGNRMLASMFGVMPEEIIGANAFDYILMDYHQVAKKNMKSGYETPFELTVRRKDGSTFPVETLGRNIRYNGKDVRVAAIRDITDRKNAERELAQLASVVRFSSELISMADLDGRIIFVNDAGSEILGIEPGDFGGVRIEEVIADSHRGVVRSEVMKALLETGFWRGELRYVNRKSGKLTDVYATTFAIKDQATGAPLFLANVSHDITERKRTEKALLESESRYRSLFEESSVSIWENDLSRVAGYFRQLRDSGVGDFRSYFESRPDEVTRCAELVRVVSVNRETRRLFRIPDDFPPESLMSSFVRESTSVFREELISLAEGNTYFKTETPALKENGELAQMILCLSVVPGHENDLGRVYISFIDITDRTVVEEELKKYRDRLEEMVIERTKELEDATRKNELILASVGDGIFGVDLEGRITFVNPAAEQMLEWSRAELIGRNAHQLLHHTKKDGSLHDAADCLITHTLVRRKKCQSREDMFWRRDGTGFVVEFISSPIGENDMNMGAVVVFRDITRRMMTEKALADERNLMRTLIDGIPDQIYAKDRHGRFVLANSNVVKALGKNGVEEILGKTDYDFFPHEQAAKSCAEERQVLDGGAPLISIEEAVRSGENIEKWYSITKVPLRDWKGEIKGIVGINRDITGIKNAEKRLREARDAADSANRAKSTFLSRMSHEIRTPMNAILGFAQLMTRDPDVTTQQKEKLNTISRSGEHLLSLINDILEISKIEAGKVVVTSASFDLHDMLNDLDMMFRIRTGAKGLKLLVEWPVNLPRRIRSDEGKLRQILINLMGNAVKFTDEGGIALRARADEVDGGCLICIDVEDSGTGIAQQDMAKLFRVFEQTETGMKAGGTGLGLAISIHYAKILGGDITVKSEAGKGSCFTVKIPVDIDEEVCAGSEAVHKQVVRLKPGLKTYRVLVADDRDDNRALAVSLLEGAGFAVVESVDGLDAIRKFSVWNPDIILMDLNMPVLDGYEAIRRIRMMDSGGTVPIIAVTASAFEEDRRRVLEMQVNGYLRKPFKADDLFEALKDFLDIEYCYNDEEGPGDACDLPCDMKEEIAGLPEEMNRSMLEAAINLDQDLLIELIGNSGMFSPQVAEKMSGMVRQYRFEQLINLLGGDTHGIDN